MKSWTCIEKCGACCHIDLKYRKSLTNILSPKDIELIKSITGKDGWLCEKGNKISIEAATVAGDFKTLLKDILNIEKKQYLTTSGISPHIWVKELSITGDA